MNLHQTLKNDQARAKAEVLKATAALKQVTALAQKAIDTANETVTIANLYYNGITRALELFKEAPQTKAAVKAAPVKTPKPAAKTPKPAQDPVKKLDGRSKEARALKAAQGKTPAAKKSPAGRQAQGRRDVAEGKRPSLRDAVIKVMGNRAMSKAEVFDALKAKGWLPNSDKPLTYIGYTLSSTKCREDDKHLFARVPEKGRGFYRVRPDLATLTAQTPKAKPGPKAKAAKVEEVRMTPLPTNGASASADQVLRDAGLDPIAPFGG